MPANPATPKTIHRVGNSGDPVYDTGGTVVVVVTVFVRTAEMTGRLVALVVDPDIYLLGDGYQRSQRWCC